MVSSCKCSKSQPFGDFVNHHLGNEIYEEHCTALVNLRIYVVSVIGAQSSAKSTLLNFLFGSGFAVSSGRCTRGLYASYFSSGPKGRPVLVLDSEGLLSLGSEGSTFDGQIVAGKTWQNRCGSIFFDHSKYSKRSRF